MNKGSLVPKICEDCDCQESGKVLLLIKSLQDVRFRDSMMMAINRETAPELLVLWSAVARKAERAERPAPLVLVAFAAWVIGEKNKAVRATREALELDPGYRMATLLQTAILVRMPVERFLTKIREFLR